MFGSSSFRVDLITGISNPHETGGEYEIMNGLDVILGLGIEAPWKIVGQTL